MASQLPPKIAQACHNMETAISLTIMAVCFAIGQHIIHPQGLARKAIHRICSSAISAFVKLSCASDPRYGDETLLEYLEAFPDEDEEDCDLISNDNAAPQTPLETHTVEQQCLDPVSPRLPTDQRPPSSRAGPRDSQPALCKEETVKEHFPKSPATPSSTDSEYKSLLTLTPNSVSCGHSSPDTPYTPPSASAPPKSAAYFPDLKRIPRTCNTEMEAFPPRAWIESEYAMYQNELLGNTSRKVKTSLEFQWNFYEGEPTRAFDCIKEILEPLSLVIHLSPSDDPLVMKQRYDDLGVFLSSDIVISKSSAIHSIDICIPHCPGFVFESASHPYDNSDSGYYGISTRNQFPNLVEFGWTGSLGRRRGDSTYASLPAPFYDIVSLPFSQMRRLEFQECFLTQSDCCLMTESSPFLETFVVDTVVGTFLPNPFSETPRFAPPLTVWPEAPSHGNPVLGFIREDGLGMDRIEAKNLSWLDMRTTVSLSHFLWQLDAPLLETLVYEPTGRGLGQVKKSNFPWTALKASLQSLSLRCSGIDQGAAKDLRSLCHLKGIELEVCTSTI
ncbi:hypothetical protein FA13DRAFT_1732418 [Coprinellus micaceus]|uniref:Uncharacterized protein n=1 Tax=Coprinellus micaceus TaxID=71717 RepID=A0A4Y7TBN3_COPMI|nr:hypothetical protein FA13DRAFT_1732418 [Coprinellus micaceus]